MQLARRPPGGGVRRGLAGAAVRCDVHGFVLLYAPVPVGRLRPGRLIVEAAAWPRGCREGQGSLARASLNCAARMIGGRGARDGSAWVGSPLKVNRVRSPREGQARGCLRRHRGAVSFLLELGWAARSSRPPWIHQAREPKPAAVSASANPDRVPRAPDAPEPRGRPITPEVVRGGQRPRRVIRESWVMHGNGPRGQAGCLRTVSAGPSGAKRHSAARTLAERRPVGQLTRTRFHGLGAQRGTQCGTSIGSFPGALSSTVGCERMAGWPLAPF